MAMPFRAGFEYLVSRWTDELIVPSAGNSCQMWWNLTRETERVFYLDASMSLSTLFGSGIAYSVPEAHVWAFIGDGAFCMNPGTLMVERDLDLPNLTHILVSNRVYGGTSDIDLPNRDANDYVSMARSMGVERVFAFDAISDLQEGFEQAFRGNREGLTFVVLEVEPLTVQDAALEGPPMDGPEIKFRFGRYIERTYGKKIFTHQI